MSIVFKVTLLFLFLPFSSFATGLDSGDKWRINKLEGKKATAARADDKPKTETPKVKEEKKDTKKAMKTKTMKGDKKE